MQVPTPKLKCGARKKQVKRGKTEIFNQCETVKRRSTPWTKPVKSVGGKYSEVYSGSV